MTASALALRPAAEYVRMSTDQQVYSIDNQRDAIRQYAGRKGLQIVKTFTDAGRSGLTVDGRPGLQGLLEEIISGRAHYEFLIVYDISRWGRFQDADESAHYEYLCRRAGVNVVYCAEPFLNEPSGFATAMKGMKRAMAAEYSRELSDKVYAGQCRLVRLGFRQGGRPGLGFRRRLIDASGCDKGLLRDGERKGIQSDRVVLTLGPPNEVALVRRIFQMFVELGLGERAIADALNAEGATTDRALRWRPQTVHCLLTNEKYTGNAVFGKTRGRLRASRQRATKGEWVRADEVHPAIVTIAAFAAAQRRILERRQRLDDAAMLEALRRVWRRHGDLSERLINRTRGVPKAYLYKSRFGGLLPAYRLIGFTPVQDGQFRIDMRQMRTLAEAMSADLCAKLGATGAVVRRRRSDLQVDGLTLAIRLIRPQKMQGNWRWVFRAEAFVPDILALVRLSPAPSEPIDVFVIPKTLQTSQLRLSREVDGVLARCRFADLTILEELCSCAPSGPRPSPSPANIAARF